MRSILATVLLLTVCVLMYMSTVGGDAGLRSQVSRSGGAVDDSIERINP